MLTHGKSPHAKSNFHLRLSSTSSCGATPPSSSWRISSDTVSHVEPLVTPPVGALKKPQNERHGSTEAGHTRLVGVTRVVYLPKNVDVSPALEVGESAVSRSTSVYLYEQRSETQQEASSSSSLGG